jgi:hypothetical protein
VPNCTALLVYRFNIWGNPAFLEEAKLFIKSPFSFLADCTRLKNTDSKVTSEDRKVAFRSCIIHSLGSLIFGTRYVFACTLWARCHETLHPTLFNEAILDRTVESADLCSSQLHGRHDSSQQFQLRGSWFPYFSLLSITNTDWNKYFQVQKRMRPWIESSCILLLR